MVFYFKILQFKCFYVVSAGLARDMGQGRSYSAICKDFHRALVIGERGVL